MKRFEFLSKYSVQISILILSIFFLLNFPAFFGTNDEHCYLRNAWNLTREGILQNDYGESLKGVKLGEGYVNNCLLGSSIPLIPFTYLGWNFAFVGVFIFFCAGIFYFNKILREYKLNPGFTYLYAFFPAFVYYSRTLFAEQLTTTLFLIGIYYFIKRDRNNIDLLIAGAVFGFSIVVRYTQAIPVALVSLFVLYELIQKYRDRRKNSLLQSIFKGKTKHFIQSILYYSLPIILCGIIIAAINQYLFGGPFKTAYTFDNTDQVFNIALIPINLIRYFIVINIIFPGMLIGALLFNYKRKFFLLSVFGAMLLFYCTFGVYLWEGRILDMIFGIRYLVPFIPLILIGYANSIQEIYFKLNSKIKTLFTLLFSLMIIVFGIAAYFVNYIHQQEFLIGRAEIVKELKTYVTDNSMLIGEADDFIYLMEPYNNKLYEDVGNIDKLEDSKSKYINTADIYLMKIVYPYRGTGNKPTEEWVKFYNQYQNKLTRIDPIDSNNWIEIYKLNK